MKALTETACELLQKKQAFVLATIIRQHGSTPRGIGAKMIVADNGKGFGTIGGGLLEATVMERAQEILSGAPSCIISFDLTSRDAADLGMICGGDVEVLLDHIEPTDSHREIFTAWNDALQHAKDCRFVTVIHWGDSKNGQVEHGLIQEDGKQLGRISLPADTLQELTWKGKSNLAMKLIERDNALILVERTQAPVTVYIFGAGHVAQPTAHLAALVGFRVVVLDDRKQFANPERFPAAHQVEVLPDFSHVFAHRSLGSDAFVVIITRGHRHDRVVLAQALETQAGYVGMIGSRKKIKKTFDILIESGVSQEALDRVHSPIGLDICAETPEEIGVSSVAERIIARAGNNPIEK